MRELDDARAAAGPDRSADATTDRRIAAIWALLMINVLSSSGTVLLPVPRSVLQLITMASLGVAFILALRMNPRVTVQFTAFLIVLSALALLALISSARVEAGLGSLVRCVRLCVFVATLWLLTPWWRGDLRFVRLHIYTLSVVLLSVLLGMIVSPGLAFSGATGGRLAGILWPIPATQVGQYGAVVAGLGILLWACEELKGRPATLIILTGVACLLLSRTRTSLIGLLLGLLVAGLGLLAVSRRARRTIGVVPLFAAVAALALPDVLMDWFNREQNSTDLAELTGRTKVWDALLAEERSATQQLIGIGLTDKSYGGVSIDNTWLATYQELGVVGVAIVVAMLVSLLVIVALRPPSLARRCALFLVVYCMTATYTEVGLGDASPYLLHLAVAASLLTARDPHPTQ